MLIPQRYEFSSKSQPRVKRLNFILVVADTTKVRIFKQITTTGYRNRQLYELLLIPQRYEFSSKSQRITFFSINEASCCWYHKGTNFQANHNHLLYSVFSCAVVADTTKVRIFKQITTCFDLEHYELSCCWYHKGTNFQANHNNGKSNWKDVIVVADTTKVRIFKQITTYSYKDDFFSGCCWYHKGTNFQANHNRGWKSQISYLVVADTTKVRIFKQITTALIKRLNAGKLLLIPQRYEFSSKSQQAMTHNSIWLVVADTTKVRIFKQITTPVCKAWKCS